MNPLELRRREDLRRVRALCDASGGRLRLVSADSEAPTEIRLQARARVALDSAYPARVGHQVDIRIVIPAGYPFRDGPRSFLTPVVWHPNVFPDGQVCQGRSWRVSDYLDLYVRRILRILTYQQDVTNLQSVANAGAAAWYRAARVRHPDAFPSDTADAITAVGGTIGWKDG